MVNLRKVCNYAHFLFDVGEDFEKYIECFDYVEKKNVF